MQFTLIESRRIEIGDNLQACRRKTLDLFSEIDSESFSQQAHPDFSPIGWHLGHIAFTEAYWILEYLAGLSPQFPQYKQLFAADGLPKAQRQKLPSINVILEYLNTIRTQVLNYLQIAPLEKQERLWRWLIQHESQHSETMNIILQLLDWNQDNSYTQLSLSQSLGSNSQKLGYLINPYSLSPNFQSSFSMTKISGGDFKFGSNTIESQDNERPCQRISLENYEIDSYPVTCAQYQEFMLIGGYQKRQFWSEIGWKWLEENSVSQPLYWVDSPDWNNHPVCGVSWYEAEAYANFIGKRLPTEAEWEKAASWNPKTEQKQPYPWGNMEPNPKLCNYNTLVGHTTPVNAYPAAKSPSGCYDMLGNVWEWTDSWFAGYEGFNPYPYPGYSQVYFDNQHRVLRGGSWATRPWSLRNSFRNWYYPSVRQIFAGFRCARTVKN